MRQKRRKEEEDKKDEEEKDDEDEEEEKNNNVPLESILHETQKKFGKIQTLTFNKKVRRQQSTLPLSSRIATSLGTPNESTDWTI